MKRSSNGFTMIELIIVIFIGSILTGIAVRGFGGVQTRGAARGATQVFASMQARARAQAIEYGDYVVLRGDTAGDSIWVQWGDSVLEMVHLRREFNVGLGLSSGTQLSVCMNPRGWAESSCNSHASTVTVSFSAGGDTASAIVLPLGQVRIQ